MRNTLSRSGGWWLAQIHISNVDSLWSAGRGWELGGGAPVYIYIYVYVHVWYYFLHHDDVMYNALTHPKFSAILTLCENKIGNAQDSYVDNTTDYHWWLPNRWCSAELADGAPSRGQGGARPAGHGWGGRGQPGLREQQLEGGHHVWIIGRLAAKLLDHRVAEISHLSQLYVPLHLPGGVAGPFLLWFQLLY